MFDKVKEKLSGDTTRETKDGVVMPSDDDVIDYVAGRVELTREEVDETVKKFQEVSHMVRPMVDEQAVEEVDQAAQAKGEGTPSFIYQIHEDDDVLAVGGAKSVMASLADRLDYDSVETKAVVLSHRVAAERAGLAEHMVMDDVYMLPKTKRFGSRLENGERERIEHGAGGGATQALKQKMEEIKKVEEDGYRTETSRHLKDSLSIDSKKYVGVDVEVDGDSINVYIDPRNTRDSDYPGIITPGGDALLPEQLAGAIDLDERDLSWRMEKARLVGEAARIDDLSVEGDEEVRTSVVEDNIDGAHRVMLPGRQVNEVGLHEGEAASVYLEPHDGELYVVVTPRHVEYTSNAAEVDNIGTGTDMLCVTLPEGAGDVLGLTGDRPVGWRVDGQRLVGELH
ncbi:MAG: hypothetical protein ACLFMT_05275 [Halobacteriales archaeon]